MSNIQIEFLLGVFFFVSAFTSTKDANGWHVGFDAIRVLLGVALFLLAFLHISLVR